MKIETTYIEPNKKFMQYTPVPLIQNFQISYLVSYYYSQENAN